MYVVKSIVCVCVFIHLFLSLVIVCTQAYNILKIFQRGLKKSDSHLIVIKLKTRGHDLFRTHSKDYKWSLPLSSSFHLSFS